MSMTGKRRRRPVSFLKMILIRFDLRVGSRRRRSRGRGKGSSRWQGRRDLTRRPRVEGMRRGRGGWGHTGRSRPTGPSLGQ
jgi:hypothetical protein